MEIDIKGYRVLIDDEDYEIISKLKLHPNVRKYQVYFTYNTRENKKHKCKYMHRLIMDNPKGMVIDHINGDTLDNRKSNLRICTQSDNHCNARAFRGTSNYKGVCWSKDKKRWFVRVKKDRKQYHVGYYKNEIEAAKAYDKVAKEIHGEYARLNFPKESVCL